MYVCLTTSGTGSRLFENTKYTNKSLLKLGDKYIINYIIDSYSNDTTFIVTLGHYGSHVEEFLRLAYPNRNFIFKTIDKYEGEGSSLGYSLLQVKDLLQTSFYFHCCDTICLDSYEHLDENTLFLHNTNDYKSYSTIDISNNTVVNIYNKGEKEINLSYIGKAFIKNYNEFWESLELCYNKNPNNFHLNDIDAFKMMLSNNISFNYNIVNSYYDIGNLTSYNNTKKYFKNTYEVLDKYNESLCFLDKYVIKFVHDSNVNIKRVKRGINLHSLVPAIVDSKNNFIKMEKIDGIILSEYPVYGEINKLLEFAEENLWINKTENSAFKEVCKKFYYDKTLERINKIACLSTEKNTINGIFTDSITNLINTIDFDTLYTDTFFTFHGDFILDNIIKTENCFKLIDWRDDFGGLLYNGDKYYDLAKLKHNIIFNHKNINNNLYDITHRDNSVIVDLKCNYFLMKQLEDYNSFIKKYKYDLHKINILVSLIWLNMCPLYEGKLSEFLFYFGKLNLHLAVQERP
jgi:NDP-sugar pyrophosphorylase family protein